MWNPRRSLRHQRLDLIRTGSKDKQTGVTKEVRRACVRGSGAAAPPDNPPVTARFHLQEWRHQQVYSTESSSWSQREGGRQSGDAVSPNPRPQPPQHPCRSPGVSVRRCPASEPHQSAMEEILRRLQKEASGHKHKAVRDACVYACGEFRRLHDSRGIRCCGKRRFYSKCVIVELPVWLHLLQGWCSLSDRLQVGVDDFLRPGLDPKRTTAWRPFWKINICVKSAPHHLAMEHPRLYVDFRENSLLHLKTSHPV